MSPILLGNQTLGICGFDFDNKTAFFGTDVLLLLISLNVNFEIDVGLHRGGFTQMQNLASAVKAAKYNSQLKITGLMGYEAHIGKMPSILNMQQRAWDSMQATYQQALAVLEKEGYDPAQLTLNSGGSPTYTLHTQRPTPIIDLV